MSVNDAELFGNHLTVDELLSARGITNKVINDYTQISNGLPRTHVKLFEPNGSWLQKKQIDTCLESRRDLIKIEKVNRLSSLAAAEWLPEQRRARVTKQSGVEWNNYGSVECGILYVMPEEALLLLELNSMELYYNGVSLSVQQAYELLIDSPNSDCTLNEYRVFSQLARRGYRLQRFRYEKTATERMEEQSHPRKKIMIDPENGGWMGKSAEVISSPEETVSTEIRDMMNKLIDKVDSQEQILADKKICESKSPKARLEIVSEETVLDPVKLIIGQTIKDGKLNKWTGARIQRNVKLLPKRLDKPNEVAVEQRKTEHEDASPAKKAKHEVIELSDDEIEEIPQMLSRMEMLNRLPNIAAKDSIVLTISRGHIPHSIKPQKLVYDFDAALLRRMQENSRNKSEKSADSHSNSRRSFGNCKAPQRWSKPRCSPYSRDCSAWKSIHQRHSHFENGHGSFGRVSRMDSVASTSLIHHKVTQCRGAETNFAWNRWSSFQVNIFWNFAAKYVPFQTMPRRFSTARAICNNSDDSDDENYHSAFAKMPANSWAELKKMWKEAKTITIDDEDDGMDCSEVEVVQQTVKPLVNAKNARSLAEVYERLRIIKSAQERTVRKKRGDYKISYKIYSNTLHYRKSNPGPPMFHLVITSRKKNFLQPVDLNRLQQDGDGVAIMFAYVCGSSITFMQAGIVSLPTLIAN